MVKKNNRGLTIIATIYLFGIFSSIILVRPGKINFSNDGLTFFGVIQTFCLNYWYIFIMWIMGLSMIGFIFNLFITYFRGFIYGTLVVYLIRINFSYFILITLLDLVVFIPMFFIMSYYSVLLSYNIYRRNQYQIASYEKLLIISIVVIFVYSLLLEIIGSQFV